MKKLILAIAAIAVLASCNFTGPYEVPVLLTVSSESVSASFAQPEYGGPLDDSASACTKGLDWKNNSLRFDPWDIKRIGVLPQGGDSELMMYSVTPSATEGIDARFKVENFTLKEGRYCAVFPAKSSTFGDNALEISLAGQRQLENAGTSHLSACDYNVALADVTPEGGSFSFATQVAWIRISASIIQLACFRSIILTAEGGIPSVGELNPAEGTISFSGSDDVTLWLGQEDGQGIYLTVGQDLAAYVTLPARTYTNLSFSMTADDGREYCYTVDGTKTLEAGKFYTVSMKDNIAPGCQIQYTATAKVEPNSNATFGEDVSLISNQYSDGKGRMIFSSPVKTIGWHSFNYNEALTGIVIPESVTSLGEEVFFRCSNLASVSLPAHLKSMGSYCFGYCKGLKEIRLPQEIEEIPAYCFHSSELTRIEVPEGIKYIQREAFEHCVNLNEIILPSTLVSIADNAFFAWYDKVCPIRTLVMKGQTPPELSESAMRGCCVTHLYIPVGSKTAYSSFIAALPDNVIVIEY